MVIDAFIEHAEIEVNPEDIAIIRESTVAQFRKLSESMLPESVLDSIENLSARFVYMGYRNPTHTRVTLYDQEKTFQYISTVQVIHSRALEDAYVGALLAYVSKGETGNTPTL